jgi:hypothetical protein
MNSAGQWYIILAEFVAIVLVAIGYLKYQKRFIAFEDRTIKRIKRRLLKCLFKETLLEPEGRDEWGNR